MGCLVCGYFIFASTQGRNVNKFLYSCLLKIVESCKFCAKVGSILQRWSRFGTALITALIAAPGIAYAADAQQIVSTVCAVCHGPDGISVAPIFPNLAGQYNTYLTKQLGDYIAGRRKNDIMSPNVATLTPDDVSALAAYFSARKPAAGRAGDAKLIEAGKIFYTEGNTDTGVPGCVGCHLEEGVGNKTYPRVAGQNSTYIAQQLADFRSGIRTNDNGSLMRSVTAHMTDQEIAAVAEYLASLGQ